MLEDAAQQRLKNFMPMGEGPKPQGQQLHLLLVNNSSRKPGIPRLGQQFSERQQAASKQCHQFDAAVNQLRQKLGASVQPQGRSKGNHDEGI